MIKNFFQKNIKKGFTLVETLVAITILMISIGGPMVLVGNGINVSRFSRDQVTAFYIAQDAVEALRFLRDADRIQLVSGEDEDWNILNSIKAGECAVSCDIDTVSIYRAEDPDRQYKNQWDDENTNLGVDADGYFRHNDTVDESKFKRSIVIEPRGTNEIDITVTVTWDSGSIFGSRSFTVKESLFYWY